MDDIRELNKICPSCGAIQPSEIIHCRECGERIEVEIKAMMLLGRLTNGSELDHGKLYHAVPCSVSSTALCGAKPGRRSVGWMEYKDCVTITCPRCLKKLEKYSHNTHKE